VSQHFSLKKEKNEIKGLVFTGRIKYSPKQVFPRLGPLDVLASLALAGLRG